MFVSIDRQSMIFIKGAHPEFSSRLTNLLNLIANYHTLVNLGQLKYLPD